MRGMGWADEVVAWVGQLPIVADPEELPDEDVAPPEELPDEDVAPPDELPEEDRPPDEEVAPEEDPLDAAASGCERSAVLEEPDPLDPQLPTSSSIQNERPKRAPWEHIVLRG
jgi:hypothetical protein